MDTNHSSGHRKVYIWILVIAVIILVAVMLNVGSKGTQPVANQSTKSPMYVWKAGALQVRGGVVPETCALTTKNCACNLSESNAVCTFNFNFRDISNDVSIQVKQDQTIASKIMISRSSGCSENKAKQIENCSIDFQWSKEETHNEKVRIVMDGANGSQSLVNLQINIK